MIATTLLARLHFAPLQDDLASDKTELWVGIGAEFASKSTAYGRVKGFTLSSGRTNGIEFERAQD